MVFVAEDNPFPDGGGIKGVSSLIIEQALMNAVKEEEKRQRGLASDGRAAAQRRVDQETPAQKGTNLPGNGKATDETGSDVAVRQDQKLAEGDDIGPEPLPCEYFDFIFGTSTGGYEMLT